MFNQTVDYAFRMIRFLAGTVGVYVVSAEIVEACDVPPRYGQEILKHLVKRGVLVARKGTGGGNMLPNHNLRLPLSRVLIALDVWAWTHGDYGPDVNAEVDRLYVDFCRTMERLTIADLDAMVGSPIPAYQIDL